MMTSDHTDVSVTPAVQLWVGVCIEKHIEKTYAFV